MAGLFDGAFGGGYGILPDWLLQNPQAMASMPNAMDGGTPAGSFADRWSGTSAMPRMQSVESSPLSIQEMLGGGRTAYAPQSQPAINPYNARDEVGAPPSAIPQSAPAQAPQQMTSPGFGDRLGAGLLGFLNGGAPLPAIGNLISGLATGQRADSQGMLEQAQRAAIQYVSQAKDIDPTMRQALMQNPALAVQYLQSRFKGGTSSDITEYEYAKGQGFKGTLADWMARKRAGAGEYGLQAVWGTGPDGKPAIVQLGKSGEAISPKLPEGFQPARGVEKVDLGDSWAFVDKQTGQTLRIAPKNIEAKESAEERGKATGQAQVALPGAILKAQTALDTIEKIRTHPGKEYGVGVTGIIPGVPGTQQKDFVSLVDQAKGQAFLAAFESLKGAGAITETEGAKATQAIARLDRTQSKAGFDAALRDLESVLKNGLALARQKAGGGAASPAATAPADPLGIR